DPTKRKRIREFDFARTQNPTPGEENTGDNGDRPRKPPGEVQSEKDMPRNVVVAMGRISLAGEMNKPFPQSEMGDEIRHSKLQPNGPRRGDQEKNQDAFP